MGRRGPVPADTALKPNQMGYTASTLPAGGYTGPYPPLEGRHEPETEAWYETWATSPQAAVFLSTDWQRLQVLAYLYDDLYEPTMNDKGGRQTSLTALVSEIRQNEARLGATVSDRLAMYMKVATPTGVTESDDSEDDLPPLAAVQGRQERMHIVSETG